jgi:hypothetical protein
MKGQYRPDNPTLLPGELFIPVLDGYGKIIVTGEVSPPNPGEEGSSLTDVLISPAVKTVPTGTAESIATTAIAVTGVIVQAPTSNTIAVRVGAAGVTTSTGLEFLPGASKKFAVSDPALIHCIATDIGQTLLILVE